MDEEGASKWLAIVVRLGLFTYEGVDGDLVSLLDRTNFLQSVQQVWGFVSKIFDGGAMQEACRAEFSSHNRYSVKPSHLIPAGKATIASEKIIINHK